VGTFGNDIQESGLANVVQSCVKFCANLVRESQDAVARLQRAIALPREARCSPGTDGSDLGRIHGKREVDASPIVGFDVHKPADGHIAEGINLQTIRPLGNGIEVRNLDRLEVSMFRTTRRSDKT